MLTLLGFRWDKTTYDAAQKDRKEQEDAFRPDAGRKPTKERTSMAEQAQALLKGKEKWRPTPTEWEDVGEAVEVEADVTLPKMEK